jgi:cell division protein FtsL
MNTRRQQVTNPVSWGKIILCSFITLVLITAGTGFVLIVLQQHSLGSQTRDLENQIRELTAYNQVLRANVTRLSSRASIQQKVGEGMVALIPIADTSIARFTPPSLAVPGGELRTASAALQERLAQ